MKRLLLSAAIGGGVVFGPRTLRFGRYWYRHRHWIRGRLRARLYGGIGWLCKVTGYPVGRAITDNRMILRAIGAHTNSTILMQRVITELQWYVADDHAPAVLHPGDGLEIQLPAELP